MAIPIKQTDKTLIFDLRDFAPIGQEKHYLLCLNENTYKIVFELFAFYGSWLNRYAPNQDLETWYQPDGEQAIFVGDMYDRGMEELLKVACFDEFIKVQRMLVASIAGEQVVLDDPLPASVNYTVSGLSPKLTQLNTTMQEIRDKLGETDVNTDDLEEILDAVNVILGGAAILGV